MLEYQLFIKLTRIIIIAQMGYITKNNILRLMKNSNNTVLLIISKIDVHIDNIIGLLYTIISLTIVTVAITANTASNDNTTFLRADVSTLFIIQFHLFVKNNKYGCSKITQSIYYIQDICTILQRSGNMTTCDNCSEKIDYKTKLKLQKKNRFEITCPNCSATLKATRGSVVFFCMGSSCIHIAFN